MSSIAHDCVGDIIIDREGRIVSFSDSMQPLGLTLGHMGHPWREAIPDAEPQRPSLPAAIETFRFSRAGTDYEMVVFPQACAHGAWQQASAIVRRLGEADGLRDMARRLDKQSSLTDLVAGIAHEINNPLTCINGWLQLLLDDAVGADGEPEEEAATLRMLLEEAQRVSKIVSNLLNYARPARPKQEPIRLDLLLEEILELVEYQMRNRNINIERRFKGPISPVVADPAALKQVFLNLIINAKHAMPKGGALLAEVGMAGDEVYVRIEDSGIGIPAENLSRVFERGFTTRSDNGGTGLGLPVTKEIVESHGGRIGVESEFGRGACFTIRLPVQKCSAPDAMPVRRWLQSEDAKPAAAVAATKSA